MCTRWRIRSVVLIMLAMLTLARVPAAFAQTGAASLTGIVTDQSGATVPGATVTATNQATNVAYTAVSNEAGNYTGNETSSHCFTPLALVLNRFLRTSGFFRAKLTRHGDKCDISATNIAHGFSALQRKTGLRDILRTDCRGDTTS